MAFLTARSTFLFEAPKVCTHSHIKIKIFFILDQLQYNLRTFKICSHFEGRNISGLLDKKLFPPGIKFLASCQSIWPGLL